MKTLCAFCVLFLLFGCGKKFTCPNQALSPVFIGYADAEIDSILLKRFAPGSNFSKATDSVLYTNRNATFYRHNDSVNLYIHGNDKNINDGFEYQLTNLFDGKTVFVSDLQFEKKEGKGSSLFGWGGDVCASPVITYKRNGLLVNGTGQDVEPLYIAK